MLAFGHELGEAHGAMLRIGILGAGAMGAAHAAAYASMADVEVVGIFARGQDRARSVASICKAKPFASADALTEEVDAIDVCLPTALHREFVIAALDRGKHVFCETPLALGLHDAVRMRDAARRAGRLLQVGLLMRSIGAYQHLEAAVASDEHGKLLSFSAWRLGSYLHPEAPDHKAHYGEPTIELMTFDFDVVGWLMGKPAHLCAAGGGEITALLGYRDGRRASVTASGLMPPGFPFTVGFRALFEAAAFELETVFADGPPRNTFRLSAGRAPPRAVGLSSRNPYEVELRRFVDCIAGKADPALLDADRAIEALVLSLATQRALALGAPVEL
jgi:predicted dehydrogenase